MRDLAIPSPNILPMRHGGNTIDITHGKYGALLNGNSATRDTAAFIKARDELFDSNQGGTILIPEGKAVFETVALQPPSGSLVGYEHTVNVQGVPGSTFVKAAQDGKFAMYVQNNVFAQSSYWPVISGIVFDGRGTGNVQRLRGGLYAPRRIKLHECAFIYCSVGLLQNAHFYGVIDTVNAWYCGIGMGFVSRVAADTQSLSYDGQTPGSTPIATEAGSVDFPMPANDAAHVGNKYMRNLNLQLNGVGMAFLGGTNFTGNSPNINIDGVSFEANSMCSLVVADGMVQVSGAWFEANPYGGSGSNTYTMDGATWSRGGVYCGVHPGLPLSEFRRPRLKLDGPSTLEDIHVGNRGRVVIDGTPYMHENPVVDPGGDLRIKSAALPSFLPHKMSGFKAHADNYAAGGLVNPFANRVYGTAPSGGTVISASDFTAASLPTGNITNFGPTSTMNTAGGPWPEQTCLERSQTSGSGIRVDTAATITAGKFYALYMALNNPDAALVLNCVQANSLFQGMGTKPLPVGDIAIGAISRFTGTTGSYTPTFTFTGFAGTQSILIYALTLVEFDTEEQAMQFFEDRILYLTV